ncbi:hypothetical protein [Nonomuraea sp. NPDC023979]|uniref:hypothetical protein n=1 Tax=Nonomuraea sp. NPDC023979 TaxID=3154796 RepID=UPI0033E1D0DB
MVKAQSRWSRVKGTRPHGSPSGEAEVVHTVAGKLLPLRRDVAERLEPADLAWRTTPPGTPDACAQGPGAAGARR